MSELTLRTCLCASHHAQGLANPPAEILGHNCFIERQLQTLAGHLVQVQFMNCEKDDSSGKASSPRIRMGQCVDFRGLNVPFRNQKEQPEIEDNLIGSKAMPTRSRCFSCNLFER